MILELEDAVDPSHAADPGAAVSWRFWLVMAYLLETTASLISEIQRPCGMTTRPRDRTTPLRGHIAPLPPAGPQPPLEALSDSELRVLRYLPTNLTAPEIARELYVSTSTVKTHIRNLYGKLGTHRRAEAVETARTLGLLPPSVFSHPPRVELPAARVGH